MTQYAASTTKDSLHIINARVTYRTAPIHLLEKFAFADINHAYNIFKDKAGLQECVILQTCNRVEIFGVSEGSNSGRLLDGWGTAVGLSKSDFQNVAETSSDRDVMLHLLKLAAGVGFFFFGGDQSVCPIKKGLLFFSH